jgi:hypothetical protein
MDGIIRHTPINKILSSVVQKKVQQRLTLNTLKFKSMDIS